MLNFNITFMNLKFIFSTIFLIIFVFILYMVIWLFNCLQVNIVSLILLPLFCLILYVFLLLKIAAFTLVERKVMGAVQRRIGPNVVGFGGLLQPFADGLKLAIKEMVVPSSALPFLFFLAPIWAFFLSLIGWAFIPFHSLGSFSNPNLGLLLILMLSSLNIYGLLLGGWSSNSKYALLGAIRSAAQMISYEVVFAFVIMPVLMITGTANLLDIGNRTATLLETTPFLYILGLLPMSIMFLIIIIAETNRAPFDLPEAEAELVAGFNVEYSAFIFALFFLGEYSSIIIMSSLYVLIFLGGWGLVFPLTLFFTKHWFLDTVCFSLKLLFICFVFVWVRATFPRLRFDELMMLCWKIFLPITFGYLMYFSLIAIYF